jgi:hypothetical protein
MFSQNHVTMTLPGDRLRRAPCYRALTMHGVVS